MTSARTTASEQGLTYTPWTLPHPNESKGLTQNFDVKVEEWGDEQTNKRNKKYISPDSMSGDQ